MSGRAPSRQSIASSTAVAGRKQIAENAIRTANKGSGAQLTNKPSKPAAQSPQDPEAPK
jgi:hypothetical protein